MPVASAMSAAVAPGLAVTCPMIDATLEPRWARRPPRPPRGAPPAAPRARPASRRAPRRGCAAGAHRRIAAQRVERPLQAIALPRQFVVGLELRLDLLQALLDNPHDIH